MRLMYAGIKEPNEALVYLIDNGIEQLVQKVEEHTTPEYLLLRKDFFPPDIIALEEFTCFDDLAAQRDRIRKLRLLPVKSPGIYAYYHSHTQEQLAAMATDMLGRNAIVAYPNLIFPNCLPKDVEQHVIWMREEITALQKWAFVAYALHLYQIPISDTIVFERPRYSPTKLVRGSIGGLRHMQLWIKA